MPQIVETMGIIEDMSGHVCVQTHRGKPGTQDEEAHIRESQFSKKGVQTPKVGKESLIFFFLTTQNNKSNSFKNKKKGGF